MKTRFLICAVCFFVNAGRAQERITQVFYTQPDSIQVTQFMCDVKLGATNTKQEVYAGIQNDLVKLFFEVDKDERVIELRFPSNSPVLARGLDTEAEDHEVKLVYDWAPNTTYKLLLSGASDTTENFSLFSGYVFLPKENKWKLIGTCKIEGRSGGMIGLATFHSAETVQATFSNVTIQRSTGSWKDVQKQQNIPAPAINWFGNADSLQQAQNETRVIEDSIREYRTDAVKNEQGVYYKIINMGAGQKISVNDTVVAYYKGYTFKDGKVFDQTVNGTATFPLKRLIRGWQIGVPIIEVGGKIKLVIPSGLAYSIRTRSPKIPPNSILVFEIEVVDIKRSL